MSKKQIEQLKKMMKDYQRSSIERRRNYAPQLLAYLSACLDGIE